MKNTRLVLLAVLLMISCINYGRIVGNDDNIRTIQFVSIFAIGALSSLLVQQIVLRFKNKDN